MKQILFKIALLINPIAGIGGKLALKGSDDIVDYAIELGAQSLSSEKMEQALTHIIDDREKVLFLVGSHQLGEDVVHALGFHYQVIYQIEKTKTTNVDTMALIQQAKKYTPDLILFSGGDGTARDICSVLQEDMPVLGVPSGVKIYSGVFALTPNLAGVVIKKMMNGEIMTAKVAQVRDLDEVAFRQDKIKTAYFGEMWIPEALQYIQSTKNSMGNEDEKLVLDDIAAEIIDMMEDEYQYLMGSGSTTAVIKSTLGVEGTLLGVDLIEYGQLKAKDVNEQTILEYIERKKTRLIVTIIGGQGIVFGRGNQQLSPHVIKKIGKANIIIVATKTKLKALQGKALIVDTGDVDLDQQLMGYYPIVTGYRDFVWYRLENPDIDYSGDYIE